MSNLAFAFYDQTANAEPLPQFIKKTLPVLIKKAQANVYQLPLPFNRINLDYSLFLAPKPFMVHRDWISCTLPLVNELLEQYKVYRESKPSAKKKRFNRKRYGDAFSMLLANLYHAYANEHQVLIPRMTAHYHDLDSNPERLSNKVISAIADFMAERFLITLVIGSEGILVGGSSTWAIPDPSLIAKLQKNDARIRLHAKSDLIILRDENKKRVQLPQSKQAKLLIANRLQPVTAHNLRWLEHTATLDGYPLITDLKRVFNKSKILELGGRFYGHYQQIPSAHRDRILIDGEPTLELDYKAHHIRILYAREGIELDGDPYQVEGLDRQTAKVTLLTLLNSEDLNRFKANVTKSGCHDLKVKAANYERERTIFDMRRAKGLKATAPAKPKALQGFIDGVATGIKGEQVLSALLARHSAIRHHIGQPDIGLRLQFTDSQIMARALQLLDDVPVLPVHDSIRCRTGDAGRVYAAMGQAYSEVTGQPAIIELKRPIAGTVKALGE